MLEAATKAVAAAEKPSDRNITLFGFKHINDTEQIVIIY
jgi:hypothetical protein